MKLKTSPTRRVAESTELVILVHGQHATVTAFDGIIPQLIRDAVTAHRVHPQIAAGGITLQFEQVSYQQETHGFTIPTPLVPRVAAAGVTMGATVTIRRGTRRRIERLSGVVERRGAARYAWNHALLEFCDSAPCGQVLVDNFGQASERITTLLEANPAANWLLVGADV